MQLSFYKNNQFKRSRTRYAPTAYFFSITLSFAICRYEFICPAGFKGGDNAFADSYSDTFADTCANIDAKATGTVNTADCT